MGRVAREERDLIGNQSLALLYYYLLQYLLAEADKISISTQ